MLIQKTIHKPITIKQTSKYKYALGLYKKTTKEINGLYSLKNGCFLYKKNNKKFIINGNDYNTPDGTCIRDYVHVSDVADAHVLADNYLQTKYNIQPTLFNLGLGKGYTNLQIINTAMSELQINIDYSFGKRREGDPSKLVANIDLAKEYLKFKPKHNLKSILRTAYNWYGKYREQRNRNSV